MSNESKKALEQFEQLLTMDEEWFQRELDSAKRMIGQNPEQPAAEPRKTVPAAPVRNYANGYGQAQPRVRELQIEEAPMPKRRGIKGLLILAVVEAMGILGLAIYWALVLLR